MSYDRAQDVLIGCVDRMLVSHSPLVESTACEETVVVSVGQGR